MDDTMNEFVIEWFRGNPNANITIPNNTRMKTKVLKLIKESCVGDYIENKDGSVYATIPVEWIHIHPKRRVSEEQREASRKRMIDLKAKGVL